MDLRHMHSRGMISDRVMALAALMDQGWTEDEAGELLARIEQNAVDTASGKRPYNRWTPEQAELIDQVLAEHGWKLPPVAVTRPLAERLDRTHKSVLSVMERRMRLRERLTAEPCPSRTGHRATTGPRRRPIECDSCGHRFAPNTDPQSLPPHQPPTQPEG